jgi:hypothetical protein
MDINEVSKGKSPHYKLVKEYFPRECKKMEEEGVLNICPYGWLLIEACICAGAKAFWRVFKWPVIIFGGVYLILSQLPLFYCPWIWNNESSPEFLSGLKELSNFVHIPISEPVMIISLVLGGVCLIIEFIVIIWLICKYVIFPVQNLIARTNEKKEASTISFLWKWAGLIKNKTCIQLKIID